jgi:hypothetical protein
MFVKYLFSTDQHCVLYRNVELSFLRHSSVGRLGKCQCSAPQRRASASTLPLDGVQIANASTLPLNGVQVPVLCPRRRANASTLPSMACKCQYSALDYVQMPELCRQWRKNAITHSGILLHVTLPLSSLVKYGFRTCQSHFLIGSTQCHFVVLLRMVYVTNNSFSFFNGCKSCKEYK